jgi:hypothetical protein
MFQFPKIIHKEQRVFRCDYICDECPNEWTDHLLVAGPSWCPCCERLTEPYHVDEMVELQAQFDLGDV